MDREGRPEVLIVTADDRRAHALAAYLVERDVQAQCAARGDDAFAALAGRMPDAVLIDDRAPHMAGREFCRAARDAGHELGILVMAQSDDPVDQVLCLEMGADDYVPAHAPWRLLWTRLKAVLRRALPAMHARKRSELARGAFLLDRRSMRTQFRERVVPLTAAEFACLWLLVERAGTVVSRDDLAKAMGNDSRGPESRAVDTQIFRLRRKLSGVEPEANRIRSIRPVGYLFAP